MKKVFKFDRQAIYFFVIATQLVIMGFYLFGPARYAFHSDDAIKTVLASIARQEGSLFPHDWVFANGDIPIASPYVFSVLLAGLKFSSYNLNALSVFLGYIFFVGCYWFFCKYTFSRKTAILTTILVASGLSLCNLEYIIAQGSYSVYAGLSFIIVGAVARNMLGRDDKRKFSTGIIVLAAFIITLSNPSRVAAQLFIPLYIAWIASFIIYRTRISGIENTYISGLFTPAIGGSLAGAAIGASLYYLWLLPQVLNFESAAKFTVAPAQHIFDHLLKMPEAWVDYQLANANLPSTSIGERLLTIISGFLAIGSLIATGIQLSRWKKISQRDFFTSLLALGLLAAPLLAMAISDTLFFSLQEMRYTVFANLLMLPILISTVENLTKKERRWSRMFQVLIVLYAIALTYSWGKPSWQANLSVYRSAFTQRQALLETLGREEVHTALATYWNSHVLTVLSNNSIHFNPITMDGAVLPYPHHSYRGLDWNGREAFRSAIVLTDAEATPENTDLIQDQFGKPSKQLDVAGYRVNIYNSNIYKLLDLSSEGINAALPPSALGLELSSTVIQPCHLSRECVTNIIATNSGTAEIGSRGNRPLTIGIHAIGINGSIVINDAGRADFMTRLEPGHSESVRIHLPSAIRPDISHYQLCLVQEGVSWYCDKTKQK